ncbi:hypothetical protein NQ318_009017 [Aromia moschata]|uniref:Protein-tyrosine sulfotransferase n=1 Tax=Aromia moschata TaxID=1265417 RepID=A0AAV8YUC7_9CUCU|nr:hypothetical protein NQ318_009017 [Aromia moschata]
MLLIGGIRRKLYLLFHCDVIAFGGVERSSDQVIKPVNLEALTKWVGNIPEEVVRDMADIAPMLSVLGYDPYANPPNYGKPGRRRGHQHQGDREEQGRVGAEGQGDVQPGVGQRPRRRRRGPRQGAERQPQQHHVIIRVHHQIGKYETSLILLKNS